MFVENQSKRKDYIPYRWEFLSEITEHSTEKNHAFEIMNTSNKYDALIPAWYLKKHKAEGATTGRLHFPH
jgi:hypothetical protein